MTVALAAIMLLAVGAATATASAPTTASNKRLAQRDAPKLLPLVNLPPGSSSQSSEPSGDGGLLASPAYTPNSPNLVDVHEFWHVPESYKSTVAYIKGHPPKGSSSEPPDDESGPIGWSGPRGPGIPANQNGVYYFPDIGGRVSPRMLVIDVVQLKDGTTGVRADAEEVWIVARPRSEKVPRGVRQIDVRETDVTRSRHPKVRTILSLKLTDRAEIEKVVRWFDTRPLNQPFMGRCHGYRPGGPFLTVTFRSASGAALARAGAVPFVGGPAQCLPIDFSIRGQSQPPLLGGYFGQLQRLLHVRF